MVFGLTMKWDKNIVSICNKIVAEMLKKQSKFFQISVPRLLTTTGILAHYYLGLHMYASVCMMQNCVIYSSRYHKFVSVHTQNTNQQGANRSVPAGKQGTLI